MYMVGLTQRISEIPLSQTEMNTSPFRPLVFLTMTSLLLLWLLLKLEHIQQHCTIIAGRPEYKIIGCKTINLLNFTKT